MDIWQIKATEKMERFLSSYYKTVKFEYAGSMLDHGMLDIFSDVDMSVQLSDNIAIDIAKLIQSMGEQLSPVFGYEIYGYDEKDMIRVCFENGWRFDISFVYPMKKESQIGNSSFTDKIESVINQFWFISFMVLVKYYRKDYLIASHLALELCQCVIVIQMLIRDRQKNTVVHRFGDKEEVPVLHSLIRFKEHGDLIEQDALKVLFHAAEHMDAISAQHNLGYPEKTGKLRDIKKYYDCY